MTSVSRLTGWQQSTALASTKSTLTELKRAHSLSDFNRILALRYVCMCVCVLQLVTLVISHGQLKYCQSLNADDYHLHITNGYEEHVMASRLTYLLLHYRMHIIYS